MSEEKQILCSGGTSWPQDGRGGHGHRGILSAQARAGAAAQKWGGGDVEGLSLLTHDSTLSS